MRKILIGSVLFLVLVTYVCLNLGKWLDVTKEAVKSEARKAIILALFVYDLIAFVMTTITVISGVLNILSWAIVLIYLFFTLGFGYFLVRPPEVKSA